MNSRKEVLDSIQRLDNEIDELNISVDLLIIGGSSLLLLEIVSDATYDIDVYKIIDNSIEGLGKPLEVIAYEHDVNCQAFNDLPLLTKVINRSMQELDYVKIDAEQLININIFVLPIEIIILSKVFAWIKRKEDKDAKDINAIFKHEYNLDILKIHFEIWKTIIGEDSFEDEAEFSKSFKQFIE